VHSPWVTGAMPSHLPGFSTPQPAVPLTYAGIPSVSLSPTPDVPLWQRTGAPQVTEQQVMNVFQSQQLTSSTRTQVTSLFTPHLSRHYLPISSAPSVSARPAVRVSMETQPVGTTSLDRVREASRMVSQVRQTRREEQAAAAAASSPAVDSAPQNSACLSSAWINCALR
jgi:hypothetical protein